MAAVMGDISTLKSWVAYDAATTDFPIQNLPYGVFTTCTITTPHIGVAIGSQILDLTVLAESGYFKDVSEIRGGDVFKTTGLNDFMACGKAAWSKVRGMLMSVLSVDGDAYIRDNAELKAKVMVNQSDATMHLPAKIGDYTDFYASKNHAYNVGVMFRGPANALQPNWTWLPVGYHGRASSVVPSGTDLKRPCGQLTGPTGEPPAEHGPCKLLDFELELGFFMGTGNELGEPVDVTTAWDKIFGVVLLNDWSARDIQRWEYVPLGPFGAKNFGTTISPWIVTMDALEPFRIENMKQDPEPLPYLKEEGKTALDIPLQVFLKPHEKDQEYLISTSNAKYLYWSFPQMVAHHTVTGCNLQPGDLLGSGTISGPEEKEYGSLLELTWKGSKTVDLEENLTRKFLQDGDSIIMRGAAQGNGYKIGFGDCAGKILPPNKKC